jgi:hypothetical protein
MNQWSLSGILINMNQWSLPGILISMNQWSLSGILIRMNQWSLSGILINMNQWSLSGTLINMNQWSLSGILISMNQWSLSGILINMNQWSLSGTLISMWGCPKFCLRCEGSLRNRKGKNFGNRCSGCSFGVFGTFLFNSRFRAQFSVFHPDSASIVLISETPRPSVILSSSCISQSNDSPLISVCVICFNHQPREIRIHTQAFTHPHTHTHTYNISRPRHIAVTL